MSVSSAFTGNRAGDCTYRGATAVEAPRIRELLDAFPNRSSFASLCDDNFSDALYLVAGFGEHPVADPCFGTPLVDPIDCSVSYRAPHDERVLRRCALETHGAACWKIGVDFRACPIGAGQILTIQPGLSWPPQGTHVIADCVAQ